MALHPSNEGLRERILTLGGPGMGKSYDWLAVARMSQKTGSPAHFYCLDTDLAIDRMLGTEFAGLENVTNIPVYDWQMLTNNLDEVQSKIGVNDWLVVDLLSPTWDMVQEYFTEQVFNKGLEEYFLQARLMDKKGGGGFEGWKDWPVINRLYRGFMNRLLRNPGHLYCTAVAEALNTELADKDTRMIFGPHGVKPKGQKHTPHYFHTVLWKTATRGGEFRITTIKDRGREYQEGKPIKDFVTGYMMSVAGWKP